MLRKQFSVVVLLLGILCVAGPVAASTLTSSNGLDVLGYSYGPTSSVYVDWAATLASGILGDGNGFTSGTSSFIAGGETFGITGTTGTNAGAYLGSTSYPMILNMPNLAAFTGFALYLAGNPIVTVTLSDGSTVTTGPLSFGSPNWVTFTSPLQIISAQIDSSSGPTVFSDVLWGTANPADLPAQPQQGGGDGGDQSDTPEGSTLWLMGGGLLGLSELIRKRKHLLN